MENIPILRLKFRRSCDPVNGSGLSRTADRNACHAARAAAFLFSSVSCSGIGSKLFLPVVMPVFHVTPIISAAAVTCQQIIGSALRCREPGADWFLSGAGFDNVPALQPKLMRKNINK